MQKFQWLQKSKKFTNLIITGAFLGVQFAVPLFTTSQVFADPPLNNKVFVCKYVGTPHVDERLQTGNNPISVSVNAIQNNQWNGQVPGYFSDAHDRSYVLAYDNGQAEPNVSECPAPEGPTATAGVVTYVDSCGMANDSYTVPTTPHVTYSQSAGVHSNATGTVTVTASAEAGYMLTDPYTFSHTFTNVSCENPDTPTPAGIVTFVDICATEDDSYTVPTTPHVTYKLTGTNTIISAGKHVGSGAVSITAFADQGYTLTGQTVFAQTFTDAACPEKKVFVCKYVGTPGVDERLQTGNNPISVSVNSLKDFNGIGSFFNDAQGRSFALAFDTGQAEPSIEQCQPPAPTKVTPAVVFANPTCENTSGRVTVTAMAGVTYKVNGSVVTGTTTYPAGSTVTVTTMIADGYELASEAQATFPHTFTTAPTNCVLGDTDVCPNITGSQTTVPSGMTKDATTGNCLTTVVTGGQGGEVLGATTTTAPLANTGDGNTLANIIIGITGVLMALGLTVLSRNKHTNA